MRLINTTTKKLEEFPSFKTPPYAILSHRWGDEEVLYQDLQADRRAGKDGGYEKLDRISSIAAAAGYGYVWIDTCCIDKTNHVELSEAINSMFSWYREAGICYAYLVDVPAEADTTAKKSVAPNGSTFAKSKWFTRGWTLQELLAPSEVIFIASDWTTIGRRTDLTSVITGVTEIPTEFLLGGSLQRASIAQRMSWIARRETTKEKDIAYCLLGIFDIHMPLLYGERQAGAFRRLQEEILKRSTDQSIFAWRDDDIDNVESYKLLASAPRMFAGSQTIIPAELPVISGYLNGRRCPTVLDNQGLHLSLPLIQTEGRVLAVLGCTTAGKADHRVAVELLDVSANGGRFIRVDWQEFELVPLETILSKAKFHQVSCQMTLRQRETDYCLSARERVEDAFS